MRICEACSVSEKEARIIHYRRTTFLCQKHKDQIERSGYIKDRTMQDKNKYIFQKDHVEMFIYSRAGKIKAIAKIDLDDFEKVKDYKWCLDGHGYAMSHSLNRIKLHQLILGKKDGLEIDHFNRMILDNRKQNLRHVTHGENMLNTKRHKDI